MRHEIGDRHIAGQDEGDTPGHEADREQRAADQLDHALHPQQREHFGWAIVVCGNPNSFAVPCSRNSNPMTKRAMLSISGQYLLTRSSDIDNSPK